jgi:hypothetical protein
MIAFLIEKATGLVKFLKGIKNDLWLSADGDEIARFEKNYNNFMTLTFNPDVNVSMNNTSPPSTPDLGKINIIGEEGILLIDNHASQSENNYSSLQLAATNPEIEGSESSIFLIRERPSKVNGISLGAVSEFQEYPGSSSLNLYELAAEEHFAGLMASEASTMLYLASSIHNVELHPDTLTFSTTGEASSESIERAVLQGAPEASFLRLNADTALIALNNFTLVNGGTGLSLINTALEESVEILNVDPDTNSVTFVGEIINQRLRDQYEIQLFGGRL